MRLLALIFGIVLIVLVAQDAFETIVLPRRVTRRIRLTQLFYRATYFGSNSIGRLIRSSARRDSFLGYMGPFSPACSCFGQCSSSSDSDSCFGDWRCL
jgi:hypothetical protein